MLAGRQDFFENLAWGFQPFFSEDADHLNNMLWADFRTWLADDLLVKVDRMSMAFSLEARVPYLDHRLVQAVFSLPGSWKVGLLSGKQIFKESVAGLVPDSIIHRKKAGFTLPLGKWFRQELKNLLLENLLISELKRSGIFEPDAVKNLLDLHFSGREDMSLQLYSILLLQLWAVRIKDGDNERRNHPNRPDFHPGPGARAVSHAADGGGREALRLGG